MSLLHLLVAIELLLNCEFYIQHPRLTLFSSADITRIVVYRSEQKRSDKLIKSLHFKARKTLQFDIIV